VNNGRTFGLYGAIFSCITLIFLLVGQRMAKDYDGARTIVIYFIPAILATYWLS
jgi:drug/metabolite transporter superfamily protein YnfA